MGIAMSKKQIPKREKKWDVIAVIIISVIIAVIVAITDDAHGQDSVWFQLPDRDYRAELNVCPECGECVPTEDPDVGGHISTAEFVAEPCSVSVQRPYICFDTKQPFTVKVGACNWIKWGKKVHPKDIDSLVDRTTGRIKDKNKGKHPK